VTAAQQALITLQDVDTGIDQLRHRRSHLPERAELTAIDLEVAGCHQAASQTAAARDEIAGQQSVVEAELSSTEARAEAVSKRLYGGTVSASRELQAMAADVESLKARASLLEDQVLELMEQREPLDAALADLSARIGSLDARRQVTAAALRSEEAVVDAELARLVALRSEAAGSVAADLLASYDRLRARLGGVAVARLVGNHCDGCHLSLPAMELDRIRHLPAGELVTCEQCGRILVHE
jgi:uncharacterized protein